MGAVDPDILLVRGAPGVGKSTAVARLRKQITAGAVIEIDVLRGMIVGVEWRNRDHHMLALDHARLVADSFLARGTRPIVIVDTLGRARIESFLPTLGHRYRIASLYADPDVLRQRVAQRPSGQFRDIDACLVINAEMRHEPYESERIIDTTEMSPDEVSAVLFAELTNASP